MTAKEAEAADRPCAPMFAIAVAPATLMKRT